MPYAVWPVSLENPDRPMQIDGALPLVSSQTQQHGKYVAIRDRTRPVVNATASMLFDPADYQTIITFWRDTLFRGKKLFLAPWIALANYDGYAARLINHTTGTNGQAPVINLKIQLVPDVLLDVTQTVPEIWPPAP